MGVIAKQSIKGALANYLGVLIGAVTTFFVVTDLLTQEEIGLTRVMVDAAMLFAGLAQLGTNASILRFYPHFKDPACRDHGFFGWTLILPFIGFSIIAILFFVFKSEIITYYSKDAPLLVDYVYLLLPLTFFVLYMTVFETNASVLLHIAVPTEAFYEDDYEVVSRNKYRVFDYETVLKEIDDKADGLPCYICDYENVGNHSFRYKKMDHIDTMKSYHEYYDTKYDLNSVVPDEERAGFIGISDHGYPILERIERIAYLKDPDAIDFDVISYLAKYMGYDITCIWDDIRESPYYTTKDQQERATRRFIQTLPHYHMLKSTESGIKALMLLFGVAADVVKLWTENENPYDEFIREYDVKTRLEADAENGNVTDYIPTPYFDVRVDIGGGQDIQFLHGDKQRVVQAIKAYKPINTVFRDIFPYLEVVAKYRVYPTMMDTRGRMTADIGFEDDFDLDSLCDD